MDRLTEIGLKYKTDKAGRETGHGFTEFYYPYFAKLTNPTILEIGVYTGASLQMMEEFYGNPKIVGVDIEPKTQYDTKCVKTLIADQSNREQLLKVLDHAKEFDIIIDDGGHTMEQQFRTIATLFPYVKKGGIYILEDLHTSFIGAHFNPRGDTFTPYDYIYRLSRGLESSPPYMSPEEVDEIAANTESVSIYQKDPKDFLHSITSVIVKK